METSSERRIVRFVDRADFVQRFARSVDGKHHFASKLLLRIASTNLRT